MRRPVPSNRSPALLAVFAVLVAWACDEPGADGSSPDGSVTVDASTDAAGQAAPDATLPSTPDAWEQPSPDAALAADGAREHDAAAPQPTDCEGEPFPVECPPDAPVVPLDDTPLVVPLTWSYSPACGASVGPQVRVVVPPGATRFGFTVDAGEEDTGFEVAVAGRPLVDADGATSRALGGYRGPAATARMPAGDAIGAPTGCVSIRPVTFTAATANLPARVVLRASDAPVGEGRVTLALGVLDGVEVDPEALAALQEGIQGIYAAAGVEVVFTALPTVAWPGGPDVSLTGERSELLRAVAPESATPLLLVSHLIDRAGDFTFTGIAGGIPGPVTNALGAPGLLVAVEWARRPDGGLDVPPLVETAAHELGHHLGLFHTSEANGEAHDDLADTPACLPEQDVDMSGVVDAGECPDATNYMFWLSGLRDAAAPFSPRQIDLLQSSLILRPD